MVIFSQNLPPKKSRYNPGSAQAYAGIYNGGAARFFCQALFSLTGKTVWFTTTAMQVRILQQHFRRKSA